MLHMVAGKAACLGEALRPEFKRYNQAVLDNARALARVLTEAGSRIVAGGTDTGLMLVVLSDRGITGDLAAAALEHAGLAVNKNQIPFDPQPPEAPSGLRLSSNAGTTRGFSVSEFQTVGHWIDRILQDTTNAQVVADVRQEVLAVCKRYPIYLTNGEPMPHAGNP
jgi:glycine hydroxymethyltransferase